MCLKNLTKVKILIQINAFKRIELKRQFAYGGAEAWRVWKLYDLRSHNWIQRDILSHIYIFITFLHFTADWMLTGFSRSSSTFLSVLQVLCQWLLYFTSWDTHLSLFNSSWNNLHKDKGEGLVSFQWCF